MIISFVFAICLGLSSSVEIQVKVKGASCITENEAHIGRNLEGFGPLKNSSWTATDCSVACSDHAECVFWNWREGTGCFLKSDRSPSPTRGLIGSGFIGGNKDCRPEEVDAKDLTRRYGNNWKEPQVPTEPPRGQRCSGRNYGERRCCTPQNPCNEGEGDCDGPGDGGQHDGNTGCKGNLVCGSNNCKQFGTYFHEKDDCCQKPSSSSSNGWGSSSGSSSNGWGSSSGSSSNNGWGSSSGSGSSSNNGWGSSSGSSSNSWGSNIPSEPPFGQRCSGRNYGDKRCCSPQNPCNEGEGDCDGPGDGGQHDGNAGCKGSLVCGSNNCKKFGSYYHEKDDCCEDPRGSSGGSSGGSGYPSNGGSGYPSNGGSGYPTSGGSNGGSVSFGGWSNWGSWSQCDKNCGGGKRIRHRYCSGSECNRTQQSQERNCNTHNCYGKKWKNTFF